VPVAADTRPNATADRVAGPEAEKNWRTHKRTQPMNAYIPQPLRANIRPFGRSNGAASMTSRAGALDMETLRRVAPSVFAEAPHSSRSAQYTYIPTSQILEGLAQEGFRPFSVMQGGSRDAEKRGFTKHLIRLRHDGETMTVGGTHNEIVLLNSHDGTSSYRLMAGIFRLVCGNGMVVAENCIGDVRIPHKGDVTGQVIDGCIDILERLPAVNDQIRSWSSLTLTEGEQRAFATAALAARYDDPAEAPVDAARLLTLRRREDAAPTLFNTLNAVQENIIKGGLSYIQRDPNGRRVARRQTREIRGIDQNTSVNRALWALAAEMEKLKS